MACLGTASGFLMDDGSRPGGERQGLYSGDGSTGIRWSVSVFLRAKQPVGEKTKKEEA
jgi:hypothetical protein